MSWVDPVGDLRRLLSDTDRDKQAKDKKIFGPVNGQNRTFYTFDDRLTTSGIQSLSNRPLRLFVDGVEYPASGINVTDAHRGEFILAMGPSLSGVREVRSHYWYQHHTESELNFFLTQAASQVSVDSIESVPAGLQLPALYIAGSLSHDRLAARYTERKSAEFMAHEGTRGSMDDIITYHAQTAERMMKQALEMRKAYYDGMLGRGNRPAFRLLKRRTKSWTPNR